MAEKMPWEEDWTGETKVMPWEEDWTEYEPHEEEARALPDRPLRAAAEGAGQMASFGYLPNIRAAIDTGSFSSSEYLKKRDDFERESAELSESNPYAYGGGAIAGGIASMAIPGGPLAKGASLASRALKGAALGGGQAALFNPGNEEGVIDPIQAKQRLEQAKTGAIIGGLAPMAVQKAAKGLTKIGNTQAVRQTGAMLKDFRHLYDKNIVEDLGTWLQQKGVVGNFKNHEGISKKASQIAKETGQKLGQIYKQATSYFDDPAFLSKLTPDQQDKYLVSGFFPASQKDEIMGLVSKELGDSPNASAALKAMETYLDELGEKYGDKIDVVKSNDIKSAIDSTINYIKRSQDLPEKQAGFLTLRRFINKKINSQISLIDEVVGGKAAKELKSLNRDYGHAKRAMLISEDRAARETANRVFGLGEQIGAGVGAAASGASSAFASGEYEDAFKKLVLGGAGGFLVGKAARRFGPGAMRVASNAGASTLKGLDAGSSAIYRKALLDKNNSKANPYLMNNEQYSESQEQVPWKSADVEQQDSKRPTVALKGKEKWAMDGLDKMLVRVPELAQDLASAQKTNKKIQGLLIQASNLKPGSKQMENIIKKLKAELGKGDK